MRRFSAALLTICSLSLFTSTVWAYSGGTGEPNNPYQIATKADLLALAANTADYDKCFILTADIDLQGQVFTKAIIATNGGPTFSGTFDGNGHKIANAVINGGGDLGLFGDLGGSRASVKNLRLDNFTVNSSSTNDLYCTGCLVGWNSSGTISNCSSTGSVSGTYAIGGLVGSSLSGSAISNCYSTCSVNGSKYVGGLVGSGSGTISNCYSTGSVIGTSLGAGGLVGNAGGSIDDCYSTGSVSGVDKVGGLAGINSGNISNCHSISSVSGSQYVGGLVGEHNQGTITHCNSTGSASGSKCVGGFAGVNGSDINNCYSTGTVTGGGNSNALGGLVGSNPYNNISNCYSTGPVTCGNSSIYIGGLVGWNWYANISNSYSTGAVTYGSSSSYLGGMVGGNFSGSISRSYFRNTAGPNNGCGTPLTDAQMKQKSSFVTWDFNTLWHICQGTNYPKLIWQILPGDITCPDGVNFLDLGELREQWLFETIPADLAPPAGDGTVNFADFAVFAGQWGVSKDIYDLKDFADQWLKTGLRECSADIDFSETVDMRDFAVLASHWLEGI